MGKEKRKTLLSCFLYLLLSLSVQSNLASAESCSNSTNVTVVESTNYGLVWSDSAHYCTQSWDWVVQGLVPENMGIVVVINHLHIVMGDKLAIYGSARPRNRHPTEEFHEAKQKLTDLFPVSVLNNDVTIHMSIDRTRPRTQYSSFNISFNAAAIFKMESNTQDWNTTSRVVCNCSTSVPPAFRCDMVQQCVEGQDEAGCDYLDSGCGEWIPYKDQCLKFVYDYIFRGVPGTENPSDPLRAKKSCADKFQAGLVQLREEEDLQFVGNILRRGGWKTVSIGLFKVRQKSAQNKQLYRHVWQWGGDGGPMAFEQQSVQRKGFSHSCGSFTASFDQDAFFVKPQHCVHDMGDTDGYVCAKPNPLRQRQTPSVKSIALAPSSEPVPHFPTKRCWDQSMVQTFHACPQHNEETRAWPGESLNSQSPASSSSSLEPDLSFPLFQCRYGSGVHYSLVCDGHEHCVDGSDEFSCQGPRLAPLLSAFFVCGDLRLVPRVSRCDGNLDCFDDSDEQGCASCRSSYNSIVYDMVMCQDVGCSPLVYSSWMEKCRSPTVVGLHLQEVGTVAKVDLDGYGMAVQARIAQGHTCPRTHYQCPSGFCVPTYVINNGLKDCYFGEDEGIPVENLTCPGFYRCHESGNCIHPTYLCDWISHCPEKDDEAYCRLQCPSNCSCQGFVYKCQGVFDVRRHLRVRYLDLSNVPEPSLVDIHFMEYLHFLNLSSCRLQNITLQTLLNLCVLDISNNFITGLASLTFEGLPRLNHLDISSNPIVSYLDGKFSAFLSSTRMVKLNIFRMVNTTLKSIRKDSLAALTGLVELDVRRNDLDGFHAGVFEGLHDLRVLKADTSKLCCFLPTHTSLCLAPVDELSSCSDLLKSNFFRVFLWSLSFFAVSGNVGVLIYRLLLDKAGTLHAYRVLVMNLCVSDCLMGVYMLMIGVADARYRGRYVSTDTEWRHSMTCRVAGFLAAVSSEVSAVLICLITLDRFLVLCFPLSVRLRMTHLTSVLACAVAWGLGFLLAAVPLLPYTTHWRFFSQTGICLPLPITRRRYPGYRYSFSIFVVFNFILFLLIGFGQAFIFRAILKVRAATGTARRQPDMTVARRLFIVVVSDFCCWFPIGMMGVLAFGGIPISEQLEVWAAVFILPLNSALNPFLYTLSTVMEKRRKRSEERRIRKLFGTLQSQLDTWPAERVDAIMKQCLRHKQSRNDVAADRNIHSV